MDNETIELRIARLLRATNGTLHVRYVPEGRFMRATLEITSGVKVDRYQGTGDTIVAALQRLLNAYRFSCPHLSATEDWIPIREAGHRERLFALLLAKSSEAGARWEYSPRLDSVRDPERPAFATRVALEASQTVERLCHFGYDEPGIKVALSRMQQ